MPSAQCRLVAGIGREDEVAVMLMTSGNAIGSAWGWPRVASSTSTVGTSVDQAGPFLTRYRAFGSPVLLASPRIFPKPEIGNLRRNPTCRQIRRTGLLCINVSRSHAHPIHATTPRQPRAASTGRPAKRAR